MPRLLLFCFSVFLAISCKPEPPGNEGHQPPQIESAPENTKNDQRVKLVVNIDQLRLRAQPGENGAVIKTLSKGAALFDLEEVSNFSTQIELRGETYNEPWFKVETQDGTSAWVYACPLFFKMEQPGLLAQFLLEKKLEMLVGNYNAERLKVYNKSYHNVNTVAGFASVYKASRSLRDTIVAMLETKIEPNPAGGMPDLFWLNQIFPGYLPQLVAEGTAYYLFADYRAFLELANTTPGTEDDEFLEVCLTAFPEDSIEYFYPAWKLQTWDYGGHSLLGRGTHYELLNKLDKLLKKSDLFTELIDGMKQDILNDITGSYVTYWETSDKIIAEIDTILKSNYDLFSKEDKIALETRKEQFGNLEESSIEVNHKSGRVQ